MAARLQTDGTGAPGAGVLDWRARRVIVFAGQLDSHIKTGEDYKTISLQEIFDCEPQCAAKGGGLAFIPSTYHEYDGRSHERQRESGSFVALTGDIDKGDHSIEAVRDAVVAFCEPAAWLIYASAHARPGNMRWRIVIPLAEPAAFEEWHDAQIAMFDFLEARGLIMDRALARAGQPVYLPNVPPTHEASGTQLRAADGSPLYYDRNCSHALAAGLHRDRGAVAAGVDRIRAQRAADDQLREQLRDASLHRKKRRPIPQGDGRSPIDSFNADCSTASLLEQYRYQQSPRNPADWRSPQQTGDTYATRVVDGGKWISLSESDAASGLGERCDAGCFGDAYDLMVHYEHKGDHRAAFREIGAAMRQFNVGSDGRDETPRNDNDPPMSTVEPVDLWARYDAPALPLGLLPAEIETVALRQADVMGVDSAGMAMAILAVCAAAITDDISLQVKTNEAGWRESARLWVGMIGPPSRKKSPILRFAMRPLAKADSMLMRAYMLEKEDYDLLTPKERKTAKKPLMKRHVVSDATIETLQEILQASTGGVISEQDELSGWFGGMDKYASGKGSQADRAFYLKAYNGGRYTVDRVSRGSKLIPNLSMSLVGGIQPDPIRKIMNETVDDGLVQRLIPVILGPAGVGKDIPNGDVEARYSRLIEKLLSLKPEAERVSQFETTRNLPLRFSTEAKSVREALAVEHLDLERALETTSPKLASHFGKYDGIFARLCIIWHCVENCDGLHPPREISGPTAQRVATFMERFIRPSAIAFYVGMLRYSDGHDELQTIASFIVANNLEEVVPRDVSKASAALKSYDADEIRRLFERLENFGWLEQAPPRRNSSKPCWRVNPAVHKVFEERGKLEIERRERSRKALLNALR